MARNDSPRFPNIYSRGMIEITGTGSDATGTWQAPSASNGCYIAELTAVTDDTSDVDVMLEVTDSSDTVVFKLGYVQVPLDSGDSVSVDPYDVKSALTGLDSDGASNSIFEIPAGYKIKATSSFTNAKKLYINVCYGQYAADS